MIFKILKKWFSHLTPFSQVKNMIQNYIRFNELCLPRCAILRQCVPRLFFFKKRKPLAVASGFLGRFIAQK
jgi:hypothetical protein